MTSPLRPLLLTFVILNSSFDILSAAPPPELTVLRQQYEKVFAERVTAPHDVALSALNMKYAAGLDRAITDAKAAGKLEDILAIEAEKKRLTDKLPIPATDGEAEPESLTKFRAIYREQSAAITTARDAAQSQLLAPYEAKLKELEAILVKNDRVDEAKEVLAYRQGLTLTASVPPPAALPGNTPKPENPTIAKTSYPKGDDRKAAEWVLSVGGNVGIAVDGKRVTLSEAQSIPRGKFELIEVTLKFFQGRKPTLPITNLLPLAGLEKLQIINTATLRTVTDEHLAVLSSLPALHSVYFTGGSLTDAAFAYLAKAPSLVDIHLGQQPGINGIGLAALSKLDNLTFLDLQECRLSEDGIGQLAPLTQLKTLFLDLTPFSDAHLPVLDGMKKLVNLQVKNTGVTAAGLAGRKSLAGLKVLAMSLSGGETVSQAATWAKACPMLDNLIIAGKKDAPLTAEDIAAFRAFPKLLKLMLYFPGVTEATVAGVSELPNLQNLIFGYLKFTDECLPPLVAHKGLRDVEFGEALITDEGLLSLTKMKGLKELNVKTCPKLTAAGLAAFQKVRPDVKVEK